ncbi:MAG: hypothetical protein AB7T27_12380 [Kiritimatiellia bacterium]
MKKAIIIIMTALLASGASAQLLEQGVSEVRLSGLVDFETADDTLFVLDVFYGIFLADYFEAGLAMGLRESDSLSLWKIGPEAEYNYDLGTELVPFIGGGIFYGRYDAGGEKGSGVVIKTDAGIKYFVAEGVAISAAAVLEWASEDVYSEKGGVTDLDTRIELGLRFFF